MSIMPGRKLEVSKKGRLSFFSKEILLSFLFVASLAFLISPYGRINPSWSEPQMLSSENGLLNATLHVKKSVVDIGGKKVESPVYNGMYPGPTFRVSPGDRFRVKLINDGTEDTNLHFHGGHVSPKGNSDNVFLSISPKKSFQYEYKIPKDHPPGLYWYHPHRHFYTEAQVLDGMAGAIIVSGGLDEIKGIKGLPEKIMVLTTVDGSDQNTPARLVNGKKNPVMYLRPNETVRLRIFNASADDFFNFAIPGTKLHILARDGNTLSRLLTKDSELLAPGNRVEMLIRAKGPGTYIVESLPYDEGFSKYERDTFMTVKVQGISVPNRELPSELIPHEDLRSVDVDRVRTITFSEGGSESDTTFLIDGVEFDPKKVSQVVTLGTTEEWRIINTSDETHPFHIHINPFQVISVNGKSVEGELSYRDTFQMPANGEFVMRTRYKNFDGKYVLHCHILFHEDHGMMQVVEALDPERPEASDDEDMEMGMDHIYESGRDSGRYDGQSDM